MSNARKVLRPPNRRLRVFSFDPSLAQRLETADTRVNTVTLEIPWDDYPHDDKDAENRPDGPLPGPVGQYLEVIDYDPASGCFYEPVNLNHPYLLAQDGLTPSDGDPQFHQQMVYAVAMKTIKNFERALGRLVLWSPRRYDTVEKEEDEYVQRLRIYPHAIRDANAYYSPARKAVLFGYFPATGTHSGEHLPGGIVFSCLSHDIIVHEVTHALLDSIHRRYNEPSNPDILAFHEAFADIVALFQHFTFPEVVEHQIAKTRGDLRSSNLLADLARQFGYAIGRSGALRSAVGKPADPTRLANTTEPHQRGAILVAAIFDAFTSIYNARTADLLRLATGGTGVLQEGALHPDLVKRLALEASKAAGHVLEMCIRALDYLPPVDITFGDYLRALITADYDLVPNDPKGYRSAFIEAFRRRGIYPKDVRSLSENSLLWDDPVFENYRDNMPFIKYLRDEVRGWDLTENRKDLFFKIKGLQRKVHGMFNKSKKFKKTNLKGLDIINHKFEIHSLRPVRRIGPGNQLLVDLLVEITQKRPGYLDQDSPDWVDDADPENVDFWFRGGCTLLIDMKTSKIRYCIYKNMEEQERYQRQRDYYKGYWNDLSLRATYFHDYDREDEDSLFSCLHKYGESKEVE